VAVAVSAMVLAGGSALVHIFLPAPAAKPAFDSREREVYVAISRFQSDLARSLAVRLRQEAKGTNLEARATRVAEEAQWVARLRSRVAERLVAHPVDVPPLSSFAGCAGGLRIQSADDAGLHGIRAGRAEECSWESMDAATRVEILRLLVGEPEDADLLGLAIVALRNGLTADADRLFARLRSSALGPVAERYPVSSDN
jgi:hypothetical protein